MLSLMILEIFIVGVAAECLGVLLGFTIIKATKCLCKDYH